MAKKAGRAAVICAAVLVAFGAVAVASRADAPPGATALCKDGTYSFSQTHSGTCSHHGGVAQWLDGSSPATTTTTSTIPAPGPTSTAPEPTVPVSTTSTSTASVTIKASWTLTPGASNPAVTQASIKKTICVSGWTATMRPSTSYTNALKTKQMVQYLETGSPSDYEEDHLIPLELGGSPRSPRNLWPEPHPRADTVDTIETSLKRQVCKGLITLALARKQISQRKHTQG
jgi:hypothetical protein